MRKKIWTGAVVVLLASAASAGTLYRWTNAEGVVAYSDALKRIPEAYRATAVRVQTQDLESYERFTPTKPPVGASYGDRLDQRVDRLRALNAATAAEQAAARAPAPATAGRTGAIMVNNKMSIDIPADQMAGDEPLVVEEQRVRTGDTTTHLFVVRQGDRVLTVVRPHTNHSDADWPTEEELLGTE